jgi:hypothetical protein
MNTPVRNFVNIKDYFSFLVRQSVVWNKLKDHFLFEITKLQNLINSTEQPQKAPSLFRRETQVSSRDTLKKELEDLQDKLTVTNMRLNLLLNEYNRTEYFMTYKMDQIEVPSELSSAFFDYAVQEMKSNLTYH